MESVAPLASKRAQGQPKVKGLSQNTSHSHPVLSLAPGFSPVRTSDA